MHVPGLNPCRKTIDVPVSGIDFFPTLVDLSGGDHQDVLKHVDGISFAPLFSGATALPRETLYWHQPLLAKNWVGEYAPQGVVRQGPWKMIHYYGNTHTDELYHIENVHGNFQNALSN
jgi:arylsulfatase A-like enzyme